MDNARSALQVGILVLLGVVLFSFGYVFFNGSTKNKNSYFVTIEFKNAGGLSQGAEVDMSGIKVGQVPMTPNSVRLDPATNDALIDLQMDKRYHIPVGSVVTVASSLLGGTSSVAIFPPQIVPGQPRPDNYHAGAVIQGTDGFNIASVGGQTGQLLDQVSKTTVKADKLIETVTVTAANLNDLLNNQRLRDNLIQTTSNINAASKQGLLLTLQLRQMLADDNISVNQALAQVDDTTGALDSVAQKNKAKLNQIVANLDAATTTLNQLTQNTNRTFTQGDVAGNVTSTVDKLKEASNNLDNITSDLHSITSDPKVQANVRETVDNLAQTTASTKTLVSRITSLVGGRVSPRGSGSNAFLANLDFSQNLRTDKFRTDIDLYAPINSTDYVRAGIYDITESNYLNLQYGTSLPYNRALDARAGVYAGKVGAGLDYHLFRNNNLSLDFYDPNRLHLDLKARVKLNNQAALIVGGEDLTRNAGAVIGVELRR